MEDLQKGTKRLKKVIQFVQKSHKNIKYNITGTGKDNGILNRLDINVHIINRDGDQRARIRSQLPQFSLRSHLILNRIRLL